MTTMPHILNQLNEYISLQKEEQFDEVVVRESTWDAFCTEFNRIAPQQFSAPAVAMSTPKEVRTFSSLEELNQTVRHCKQCALCKNRTQALTGEGKTEQPPIVFIVHGPTAQNDKQNSLYAGEVGASFERMLNAMGYQKEDVFFTSLVKCRPYHLETGKDRPPRQNEIEACNDYLKDQLKKINPKVIVTFGQSATSGLFGKKLAINQVRGKWIDYDGTPVMPTFHPIEFIKDIKKKRPVWDDLQLVMKKLK